MKNSLLQLENSWLAEVSIESHPYSSDEKELADNISLRASPEFARGNEDPSLWRVSLGVSFGGEGDRKLHYTGRIKVVGLFRVQEDVPSEKQQLLVAINAPSILYSMSREIIASLTARSFYGAFMIPSVSFADSRINASVEGTPKEGQEPSSKPQV